MRSAPIRLTKFESGLLLNYLDQEISECLDCIADGTVDKSSFEFRLMNLYDLKKKLKNAYDKCDYEKAYSRNSCDNGDM